MLMNVYSIYDTKGDYFVPPWFSRTHADAIRDFAKAVGTPGSPMGDHPADFELRCIGTWDDLAGEIRPHEDHKVLGIGIDFVHTRADNALPVGDSA